MDHIRDFKEKILTPEQVSDILCVGYRTVLKLIKSKRIKAFKINNRYRFLELELENYICEAGID